MNLGECDDLYNYDMSRCENAVINSRKCHVGTNETKTPMVDICIIKIRVNKLILSIDYIKLYRSSLSIYNYTDRP